VLTLYLLLFILFLLIFSYTFWQVYINFFQPGAVYYPSSEYTVKQILKLAKINKKDTLIDLGSGDGRILIAAAKLGIFSIGYEINPFLVWKSRRLIYKSKLDKRAIVYWKSFWKADFKKATVITVYLLPNLMNKLQYLLEKKIQHPVKIIVNDYPFTKLTPTKSYKNVYLYHLNFKKN